MANLYYHRMIEGFPERLYSSVSYAAGYSKRAFVLTTPERDDHVLIDPTDGMDLTFPDLTLLNEQGIGPRPENVHAVRFDHRQDWSDNCRENRKMLELLGEHSFENIFPFTGKATVVHRLADELGVPVRTSSQDITYWAEDKKTLLKLSHLSRVPRGFQVMNNQEIVDSWRALDQSGDDRRRAVIKAAQSASGTVSTIVENEEHLQKFISEFDFAELDGGVVEEWFDSDSRSPSINYFIYPDGTPKVLFISNQIFEDESIVYGREGTRIYRGNSFPTDFDETIQQKIRDLTIPLAEALYRGGYWGPVGFDTIVVDGTEVFITEINPRITGPHFGWRPAKNIGLPCFSLQNEKIRKDIHFSVLREALEEILYYRGAVEGYVIFNFFPGKFIGLVLSSHPKRLEELRSRVDELLKPLRREKNGGEGNEFE